MEKSVVSLFFSFFNVSWLVSNQPISRSIVWNINRGVPRRTFVRKNVHIVSAKKENETKKKKKERKKKEMGERGQRLNLVTLEL